MLEEPDRPIDLSFVKTHWSGDSFFFNKILGLVELTKKSIFKLKHQWLMLVAFLYD